MEDAFGSLPTSQLLGSVPDLPFSTGAVIPQNIKSETYQAATPSLQTFPPGLGGYQSPGNSSGGDGPPPATNWAGFLSISSYTPYFNVDTDVVADRLINSLNPLRGDFFNKIDANPDLYAPVWISTTLVFMLAAFGNCATYLMNHKKDPTASWNFDVSFFNWAACVVYGYGLMIPAASFFLLQYLGSNGSLIRLFCLWGYSLFIFIPASLMLVIPSEIFRWLIVLVAGSTSATFIATNLKIYAEGHDLMIWVVSAFLLQFCFAFFLKIFFFA